MSKKIVGLIVIILIAGLALSACERPASRAPVTTPTAVGEIPFPVATQPEIMIEILKGTQTAMAQNPQPGGLPPLVTSTPSFTFTTPDAGGGQTTPAAGGIAYPTPTPGRPATYVIQSGEFPYCIARRFNVDPVDLLNASGLNLSSRPATGYKLTIPQSGSFPGNRALRSHPTTYTVSAGETIGSIACYFGDADPNTIYAASGLEPGAALTSGQVLQIP